MTRSALPLFDGFIETPFEHRFQGLLRQAWHQRSWHVIVAEPGSGKTMGIGDLRDEACRQAGIAPQQVKYIEAQGSSGMPSYYHLVKGFSH